MDLARKALTAQYSLASAPFIQESIDEQDRRMFRSLDLRGLGLITREDLLGAIRRAGLRISDRRLAESLQKLEDLAPQPHSSIDIAAFHEIIKPNIHLMRRIFRRYLVIPEFQAFCKDIREIAQLVRDNHGGKVATYIPQLARVDPKNFAIALCTVDGQRFELGDSKLGFSVQSTSKPVTYCLALEEHGTDTVHEHVGREPSGRGFNDLSLNNKNLPHNPLINAGAIMCGSMIRPLEEQADRFDHVLARWQALAGGERVGFLNAVFLSERATAHRNHALGHYMMEKDAFPRRRRKQLGADGVEGATVNPSFPEETDLAAALEFYFQCCSIELDAEGMAVVAATLANGGVCPVTGQLVLQTQTVQNCLSLMVSCGMYDYSGEWAFTIGLPAKSGVSGALMVVVPNVFGLCIWSPRLDEIGNSVRGIAFCRELVRRFNFHPYDSLTGQSSKKDPRISPLEKTSIEITSLIEVASKGDITAVEHYLQRGVAINLGDYDGRSPLHLAAAEGHEPVVQLLLQRGAQVNIRDRWGGTPLDDALRHNQERVAEILRQHGGLPGEAPKSSLQAVLGSGAPEVTALIWAASQGDLLGMQPYIARGVDLNAADYDGRSALHLAAAEGQDEVLRYLIAQKVELNPRDRWGYTPLDDALRHKREGAAALLRKAGAQSHSELENKISTAWDGSEKE